MTQQQRALAKFVALLAVMAGAMVWGFHYTHSHAGPPENEPVLLRQLTPVRYVLFALFLVVALRKNIKRMRAGGAEASAPSPRARQLKLILIVCAVLFLLVASWRMLAS